MMSLNGILPVDKPVGPTSHDIVAATRRALGIRRIGHTGTLDPFASGLLLLCLGPATRLAEYLSRLSKSYEATIRLGATTDTDDSEGSVIRTSESWGSVDEERLREALRRQTGDILQVPARYSAKKVGGERMYDVARRGGHVDLAPVAVHVDGIELRGFAPPDAMVEVRCSSGTYVRAIARDVGDDLGTGGHLISLRRTRVGEFDVRSALTMADLGQPARVEEALVTPRQAVAHLPEIVLDEEQAAAIRHGRAITADGVPAGTGELALIEPGGELLAIAALEHGLVRPRKVFA